MSENSSLLLFDADIAQIVRSKLSGEAGLRYYRGLASACQACELHKGRKHVVCGEGLAERPVLAFVGEAPGAEEDRQGRPFVGRSGELLTSLLAGIGLSREQVFIVNTLQCRPPSNRPPLPEELKACGDLFRGQLRVVRPRVLVALGATASRTMLGLKKPMHELRGRWFEWEGYPMIPTFHPSYLLRNVDHKSKTLMVQDLLAALHRAESLQSES